MSYTHVIASNTPVAFNETKAEDYYFPIDLGGMELSMDKPVAKHHSVESIFALSYESRLMNGGNELFDHHHWMTESSNQGQSYFTHSLSNQHFPNNTLSGDKIVVPAMDGASSSSKIKSKRRHNKRPTRFPVNGLKLSRFISYDDTDDDEEGPRTINRAKGYQLTQDIAAIHAKWRWSRSVKRLRITYPLLFNLAYEGDEEFDLVLEGLVIHLRKGSTCIGVDLKDNSIGTVRNATCETDRWGFDIALPQKASKITEQPFEAILYPNTTFITPSGCKVHLSSGTGIITPSESVFFFK
jgi:hypothetical protein